MKSCLLLNMVVILIAGWAAPDTALAGESRAQLGIYLEELSEDYREKLSFDGDGILVVGVIEGTGADRAGLQEGDIIMAFDNHPIENADDLGEAMADAEPGQKVKLLVYSDGEAKKVKVTLGEKGENLPHKEYGDFNLYRDEGYSTDGDKWMVVYDDKAPYMGVVLQDLDPQLAAYFEVKNGVLIARVEEDSPAAEARIKAGDVIIYWDEERTEDSGTLYELLYEAAPGDEVDLTVVRRGEKLEGRITLGEKEVGSSWTKNYQMDRNAKAPHYFSVPGKAHAYTLPRVPAPERFKAPDFPKSWTVPQLQDFEHMKSFKEDMQEFKKELKELREEIRKLKKERN